MNIKKIIDDLNKYRDEIVEKLREKDWRHFRLYFEITEKFQERKERKIEEEFKHVFCNFYRTRGLA
jgi:tRNA U54 and U55 pseudouridine synthase Pus10